MDYVFREGMTIEESNVNAERIRLTVDPRANARYAAHMIASRLLRESQGDKGIARDMIVERRWFPETLSRVYRVQGELLTYATKVALESLA